MAKTWKDYYDEQAKQTPYQDSLKGKGGLKTPTQQAASEYEATYQRYLEAFTGAAGRVEQAGKYKYYDPKVAGQDNANLMVNSVENATQIMNNRERNIPDFAKGNQGMLQSDIGLLKGVASARDYYKQFDSEADFHRTINDSRVPNLNAPVGTPRKPLSYDEWVKSLTSEKPTAAQTAAQATRGAPGSRGILPADGTAPRGTVYGQYDEQGNVRQHPAIKAEELKAKTAAPWAEDYFNRKQTEQHTAAVNLGAPRNAHVMVQDIDHQIEYLNDEVAKIEEAADRFIFADYGNNIADSYDPTDLRHPKVQERVRAGQEASKRAEDAKANIAILEQKRDAYKLYIQETDLNKKYSYINKTTDFAEKSKYDPNPMAGRDSQYDIAKSGLQYGTRTGGLGGPEADANGRTGNLSGTETDGMRAIYDAVNANDPAFTDGSAVFDKNGAPKADYVKYSAMTDEERTRFNYLYKNSPAEAMQYLKEYEDVLGYRRVTQQAEDVQKAASDNPVAVGAGIIATAPLRAVFSTGAALAQLIGAAKGNSKYDPMYDLTRIKDTAQTAVSEKANELFQDASGKPLLIPVINQPLGAFLFNTLSSGADSVSSMALGSILGSPAAVNIIMGSQAANSALVEARDRGLSDAQAITLALAEGAIEIGTENYSTEAFFNKKGGFWKYARDSFFTNMTEEMASSALGRIADEFISADKNKIALRVNELLDQNPNTMSVAEAREQARREWLQEFGGEALAGGIMGLGFGVVGGARNVSQNRTTGKILASKPGSQEALTSYVKQNLDPNSAARNLITKYTTDEKKMTYRQAGEVANVALQEILDQYKGAKTPAEKIRIAGMAKAVEGIIGDINKRPVMAKTIKETAEKIALSPEAAEQLKTDFDASKLDEATFSDAYTRAYQAGLEGIDVAYLTSSTAVAKLSPDLAKTAYDLGTKNFASEVRGQKMEAAAAAKMTKLKPGEGNLTMHESVDQAKLLPYQSKQIEIWKTAARVLGLNAVMFQSETDADGNIIAGTQFGMENGKYEYSTGRIWIDVNAQKKNVKDSAQAIILKTAGHEVTHFIKHMSPDLYREYSRAVTQALANAGQDLDLLIDEQIARSAKGSAGEIDFGIALEEVIANQSDLMLSDSQVIAGIRESNPTLFTTIKDWITDFSKRVQDAFDRFRGTESASQKAIMKDVEGVLRYTDELRAAWDAALGDAAGIAPVAPSAGQAAAPATVTMTMPSVAETAKEAAQVKPAIPASKELAAGSVAIPQNGSKGRMFTNDNTEIDFHYALVPAGSVIASNTTDFAENPAYPQDMQPRERTDRDTYKWQIEGIAKKLNPARLGASPEVNSGAPVIGADMLVENGNGRMIALQMAMQNNGKPAQAYREWLKQNAASFGLNPEDVGADSVLVRVNDSKLDRNAFAEKGNESVGAAYSAAETAKIDARKVTPAMLRKFDPSKDYDSVANGSFAREFIAAVMPENERNAAIGADGKLSQAGVERLRNALFQLAYGDSKMTARLSEATEGTIKNIVNAMVNVAPRIALTDENIKTGQLHGSSIAKPLVEAYTTAKSVQASDQPIEVYVNQTAMVPKESPEAYAILEMFAANKRSGRAITAAIESILDRVEQYGDPNQVQMPGLETAAPSTLSIIREGIADAKAKEDAGVRFQERDSDDAPLTAEQIEYFKDSKVRDAQGRLLKVYHGTPYGTFHSFEGKIFFFSKSEKFAREYAEEKSLNGEMDAEATVVRAYLNSKRLFDGSDETALSELKTALPDEIEYGFGGVKYTKDKIIDLLRGNDIEPAKWTPDKIKNAKFGEFIGDSWSGYNNDVFVGINADNKVVYTSNIEKPFLPLLTEEQKQELLNGNKISLKVKRANGGYMTVDEYKAKKATGDIFYDAYETKIEEIRPYTASQVDMPLTGQDNWTVYELTFKPNLVELIQKLGYDGIKTTEKGQENYAVFSPEQIKSTTNLTPTSSPDIRYQERDASYLAAVESGDMDTAQKMVDEAAKAAGYTVKAYHGTKTRFNVFRSGDIGYHFGTKSQARHRSGYGADAVMIPAYLKLDNPLVIDTDYGSWESDYAGRRMVQDGHITQQEYDFVMAANTNKRDEILRNILRDKGYDGIQYKNFYEGNSTKPSYIVFDPTQIKRADAITRDTTGVVIPLSQRFTDSNDIRYQEREPVPPMYSKMAQEIEAYKGDKVDAGSFIKYLTGRGVKADEIRWSGVQTFLQGKKSVTKAELLEFARGNALNIKDVGNERISSLTISDDAYRITLDGEDGRLMLIEPQDDGTWYDRIGMASYDTRDDAYWAARDVADNSAEEIGTKFEKYALPGGINYREILFTVPDLDGTFQSAHWSEKNVLAHARMQDFSTADGKPVLFVEEVQSDWHEKGREEGYRPAELTTDEKAAQNSKFNALRIARDTAQEAYDKAEAEYLKIASTSTFGLDEAQITEIDFAVYKADQEMVKAQAVVSEASIALRNYLEEEAKDNRNRIPPAPFTTTWHEYVLKRALRMAAEGGYDYMAWTTGAMQNDRYSLAKHVDRISVGKTGGGKYLVTIYDKSNRNVFEEENVTPSRLSEVIGKEAARNVIEQAEKSNALFTVVPGDGLMLGGEGMKNFYDIGGKSSQNIPRFLNKYGAQWGAGISTIEIQGDKTYSVPAIEINERMKESVLYEGQVLYQERTDDPSSAREILSTGFEAIAANDAERSLLKTYQGRVKELNAMEQAVTDYRTQIQAIESAIGFDPKAPNDRLIRLKNNVKTLTDKINRADKKLLTFEKAAPLKNVLDREVKKVQEKQAQIRRVQLEQYRDNRATTDSKRKLRDQIIRGVKKLNDLLVNESDKRHIPEGLKSVVIEFMQPFLQDTSVFYRDQLNRLRDVYDAIGRGDHEGEADLQRFFDEELAADLRDMALTLDGRRLSQLTEAELQTVLNIVGNLDHMIIYENAVDIAGKREEVSVLSGAVADEHRDKAKDKRVALLTGNNPVAMVVKMLSSQNIKPIYFFKSLGGTMKRLFDDIRMGQRNYGLTLKTSRDYFIEIATKRHYWDWTAKKGDTFKFKTAIGDDIELTREQALSLYAISKREKTNIQQKASHLKEGGFVFTDAVQVTEYHKGIPVKYTVNTAETHPLNETDVEQVNAWLTDEQRAFADDMVAYLSTEMADLGNEASMKLYGIRKYLEKYYFPYKSSENFLYRQQGQGAVEGMQNALIHRGFTKRTVQFANNPIVLDDFTKVWGGHVESMVMYNSMVIPLENFNRVYNYKTRSDIAQGIKPESVKSVLEAAYGRKAKEYIEQLIDDLNGGVRPPKAEALTDKMIGLFKKGAVFANLSVVVQQPSAIMRAMALIDPKHFLSAVYTKADNAEMLKYSGVAVLKEMGRFDVGLGMGSAEWLTRQDRKQMNVAQAMADKDVRDDTLAYLPRRADEMTWTSIWRAVKNEVAAEGKLQRGTPEFMAAVTERFEDVIDYTQVYDSVLARSEMMRAKSGMMKSITAFMSEPTTSYNMLYDAFANRKDKGAKDHVAPARAMAAFAASIILNSLLKALVMAMRDDDEDKTYVEKYINSAAEGIIDGMNPVGMVPIFRDILSIVQGYDVNRADMALITDLYRALDKANNDRYTAMDKIEGIAGAVAAFLGVPVKNVWRDGKGIYGLITSKMPISATTGAGVKNALMEALPGYDVNINAYYRRLYDAINNGDTNKQAELTEILMRKGKEQKTIDAGLRKLAREAMMEGAITPSKAMEQLKRFGVDSVTTDVKDLYDANVITQDEAVRLLEQYGTEKMDAPDERYKIITKWNHERTVPEGEDSDYKVMDNFLEAVKTGKNLRNVVTDYMDPKKYGYSKSYLAGQITEAYKPQYIELMKTNRTAATTLQGYLLNAYVMLGYDREDEIKYIDKWLK